MVSISTILWFLFGAAICAMFLIIGNHIRTLYKRLECLQDHYDRRFAALATTISAFEHDDTPPADDAELRESRRKAVEAEKKFTDAVADIFNYDYRAARKAGNSAE